MLEGEEEVAAVEEPLELDEAPEVEALAEEPIKDDIADDDDGEVTITFDGEEPITAAAKAPDNEVIRDFRKRNREQAAELARLKAQLEAAPVAPVVEELGPVPTLEQCDWDEERLALALEQRLERKQQIERAQAARADAMAKQAAADADEAAAYVKSRSALGARDYEDAEADFVAAFPNPAFQRLIVRASNDPATVIYALHKAPARMAELASITDAAKLAAAVGRLEGKLKVSKVSKVNPERRVSGAAPVSMGGEQRYMDKLEAEAERTGDRSKIYAYKLEQKRKERARL